MTAVPHRQPCVCRECRRPPAPPKPPPAPAQQPLLDKRGRAPAPPPKPTAPRADPAPPPAPDRAVALTDAALAAKRAADKTALNDRRMTRYLALRASGTQREEAETQVDAEFPDTTETSP